MISMTLQATLIKFNDIAQIDEFRLAKKEETKKKLKVFE